MRENKTRCDACGSRVSLRFSPSLEMWLCWKCDGYIFDEDGSVGEERR